MGYIKLLYEEGMLAALSTDDSSLSGILWDGSFPGSANPEGEKGFFLLPMHTDCFSTQCSSKLPLFDHSSKQNIVCERTEEVSLAVEEIVSPVARSC